VDGAQDFEGVLGVGDGVLEERGFVGAGGVPSVSRGLAFMPSSGRSGTER